MHSEPPLPTKFDCWSRKIKADLIRKIRDRELFLFKAWEGDIFIAICLFNEFLLLSGGVTYDTE